MKVLLVFFIAVVFSQELEECDTHADCGYSRNACGRTCVNGFCSDPSEATDCANLDFHDACGHTCVPDPDDEFIGVCSNRQVVDCTDFNKVFECGWFCDGGECRSPVSDPTSTDPEDQVDCRVLDTDFQCGWDCVAEETEVTVAECGFVGTNCFHLDDDAHCGHRCVVGQQGRSRCDHSGSIFGLQDCTLLDTNEACGHYCGSRDTAMLSNEDLYQPSGYLEDWDSPNWGVCMNPVDESAADCYEGSGVITEVTEHEDHRNCDQRCNTILQPGFVGAGSPRYERDSIARRNNLLYSGCGYKAFLHHTESIDFEFFDFDDFFDYPPVETNQYYGVDYQELAEFFEDEEEFASTPVAEALEDAFSNVFGVEFESFVTISEDYARSRSAITAFFGVPEIPDPPVDVSPLGAEMTTILRDWLAQSDIFETAGEFDRKFRPEQVNFNGVSAIPFLEDGSSYIFAWTLNTFHPEGIFYTDCMRDRDWSCGATCDYNPDTSRYQCMNAVDCIGGDTDRNCHRYCGRDAADTDGYRKCLPGVTCVNDPVDRVLHNADFHSMEVEPYWWDLRFEDERDAGYPRPGATYFYPDAFNFRGEGYVRTNENTEETRECEADSAQHSPDEGELVCEVAEDLYSPSPDQDSECGNYCDFEERTCVGGYVDCDEYFSDDTSCGGQCNVYANTYNADESLETENFEDFVLTVDGNLDRHTCEPVLNERWSFDHDEFEQPNDPFEDTYWLQEEEVWSAEEVGNCYDDTVYVVDDQNCEWHCEDIGDNECVSVDCESESFEDDVSTCDWACDGSVEGGVCAPVEDCTAPPNEELSACGTTTCQAEECSTSSVDCFESIEQSSTSCGVTCEDGECDSLGQNCQNLNSVDSCGWDCDTEAGACVDDTVTVCEDGTNEACGTFCTEDGSCDSENDDCFSLEFNEWDDCGSSCGFSEDGGETCTSGNANCLEDWLAIETGTGFDKCAYWCDAFVLNAEEDVAGCGSPPDFVLGHVYDDENGVEEVDANRDFEEGTTDEYLWGAPCSVFNSWGHCGVLCRHEPVPYDVFFTDVANPTYQYATEDSSELFLGYCDRCVDEDVYHPEFAPDNVCNDVTTNCFIQRNTCGGFCASDDDTNQADGEFESGRCSIGLGDANSYDVYDLVSDFNDGTYADTDNCDSDPQCWNFHVFHFTEEEGEIGTTLRNEDIAADHIDYFQSLVDNDGTISFPDSDVDYDEMGGRGPSDRGYDCTLDARDEQVFQNNCGRRCVFEEGSDPSDYWHGESANDLGSYWDGSTFQLHSDVELMGDDDLEHPHINEVCVNGIDCDEPVWSQCSRVCVNGGCHAKQNCLTKDTQISEVVGDDEQFFVGGCGGWCVGGVGPIDVDDTPYNDGLGLVKTDTDCVFFPEVDTDCLHADETCGGVCSGVLNSDGWPVDDDGDVIVDLDEFGNPIFALEVPQCGGEDCLTNRYWPHCVISFDHNGDGVVGDGAGLFDAPGTGDSSSFATWGYTAIDCVEGNPEACFMACADTFVGGEQPVCSDTDDTVSCWTDFDNSCWSHCASAPGEVECIADENVGQWGNCEANPLHCGGTCNTDVHPEEWWAWEGGVWPVDMESHFEPCLGGVNCAARHDNCGSYEEAVCTNGVCDDDASTGENCISSDQRCGGECVAADSCITDIFTGEEVCTHYRCSGGIDCTEDTRNCGAECTFDADSEDWSCQAPGGAEPVDCFENNEFCGGDCDFVDEAWVCVAGSDCTDEVALSKNSQCGPHLCVDGACALDIEQGGEDCTVDLDDNCGRVCVIGALTATCSVGTNCFEQADDDFCEVRCTDGECESGRDCTVDDDNFCGAICQDNECVGGVDCSDLDTDGECGHICRAGECVLPDDSDCSDNDSVDQCGWSCVGGDCAFDGEDCTLLETVDNCGVTCDDGECVDGDACVSTDDNCSPTTCNNGVCLGGADCTILGDVCNSTHCVDCTVDSDCGDGEDADLQFCVDQTCVECKADTDCSTPTFTIGGTDFVLCGSTCGVGGTCNLGDFCAANFCQDGVCQGCESNSDCPSGTLCLARQCQIPSQDLEAFLESLESSANVNFGILSLCLVAFASLYQLLF